MSYNSYIRLRQARDLLETLRADGLGRADWYTLQAIANRIAHEDKPGLRGRPPTIKDTCFPGERTIAKESWYCLRAVVKSIDRLTRPETNNPTGKPYLTVEPIPGSRVNRYRINVDLFDSMDSTRKSGKKVSSFTAEPADDDVIDFDVEATPTIFLPVVADDPANTLAREYFAALQEDARWSHSGASWERHFRTALNRHSPAHLTGAMQWAFADTFWAEQLLKPERNQASVPYLITALETQIMPRYLRSLHPRPSTSTRPPTQRVPSHYATED